MCNCRETGNDGDDRMVPLHEAMRLVGAPTRGDFRRHWVATGRLHLTRQRGRDYVERKQIEDWL